MFPVEISLKNFEGSITDKSKTIPLLKGKIEMTNSITGKRMIKTIDLESLFIYENEANTLDFNTYFNCKQSPLIIWVCD